MIIHFTEMSIKIIKKATQTSARENVFSAEKRCHFPKTVVELKYTFDICLFAPILRGVIAPAAPFRFKRRQIREKEEYVLEKFFKIKEKGSTVKTEVLAGITTFMAMAYILMVNAGMFTDIASITGKGPSYGAIYIATAMGAIIGTVLIGLLSNLPLAQASGMGLNAFFVYTVCIGMGFSYANALVFIFVDGLLFVMLTVTGMRKKLFEAIPDSVKAAIPAGIGLFISFIGLQNAGIVVNSESTLVDLHSFNVLSGANDWSTIMPILITVVVVIIIAILAYKKIRGAVLYGILGGAVLYYVVGYATVTGFGADVNFSNPLSAFSEFGSQAFLKVFNEGFDFSGYLANNSTASLVLAFVTTALAFCILDIFDTMGTLYGACSRGGMLDEKGEVPNMNKAMMADAVATAAGAVCGTSTVTTYVESAAGVAEGGRTGLTSMVTAGCFVVAMFLSPVAQLIPGCATAAALIYVGVLMLGALKDIDWTDPSVSVPAFLTAAIMPFTYNISYGIGLGLLSHVLIKAFSGKIKETRVSTWIVGALFLAMFLLTR